MRSRWSLTLALAAACLVGGPPAASAGTYEVRACHDAANNSWGGSRNNEFADAYAQCPGGFSGGQGLIARNTGGPGSAPIWSQAMVAFDAPPGAAVVRVRGNYKMSAVGGWHAGIHDMDNRRWVLCGSICTNTLGTWVPFDVGGLWTARIAALTICAELSCRRDSLHGYMSMSHVTVTVAENGAPDVAIGGGSLVQGGWRSGVQEVLVDAWDRVGIRRILVSVDGVTRGIEKVCDDTRPVPCPNGRETFRVDARTFDDGAHQLVATAVDSAENTATHSATIHVDNTPPSSPRAISTAGGGAWKSRNGFTIRWNNPPQSAAPIAAAKFTVCPDGQPPLDLRGCTPIVNRSGSELEEIDAVQVPGPGQWSARIWLQDAAGNESMESATETALRFDDEPPELALKVPSAERPTEIRVAAHDAVSGLSAGEVELQRAGTSIWTSLPGRIDDKGFVVTVDDEALPNGTYRVRARAVDHAGNERSTDRRADGEPLTLVLPLRVTTRLVAGRPKRVRARGSRGRYRFVLIDRPRSQYGRTIPLSGRLTTPGANPLAGREIEIFELLAVPGGTWRRIATVMTSRTGRFTFKALRGPSRILRFRYPGTEAIRGRSTEVSLRVRAATSLRVSRKNVVNGEEVTFRGRLKSQPVPPGKLVELQAYSRGRWLTFATPRANRLTGLWSHRYRFAATRGNVRYRFRARVPRETGYPYETGTSATIRVRVRGL